MSLETFISPDESLNLEGALYHYATQPCALQYCIPLTDVVCVVKHVELVHVARQLVMPQHVLLHEAGLELLAAGNVERVDAGSQMSSDAE